MKIALVNPSFVGIKGHGGSSIPLNLCYLASYVREGNQVKVFDAGVMNWTHPQTVVELMKFSPDVIGITTTTPVFDEVIELTKQIKLSMPSVTVVAGGPHVSALPIESMREARIDKVVVGEGEMSFEDVVSGKFTPRIWRRELINNLDELPFPARDLVDNSLYSPPPTKRVSEGIHTLLSTSRGCPFNCGFCATQTIWGRQTRYRTIKSVMDEIDECKWKYQITSFGFTDELFTADKTRVEEFCEVLLSKEYKISWVCSARAQGLGLDLLKLMKRAGCVEISFGIESGDQFILNLIDKRLRLDEAQTVIRRAQSIGITTHASYMFGYIGETVHTIKKTINLARKLNTDYAAFFIASPLPGTRFYSTCKEMEYLKPNSKWSDYSPLSNNQSVVELPTISSKEVRKWHRWAIRSYYLNLHYIWKCIRKINNWNDVKNLWEGFKLMLRIK